MSKNKILGIDNIQCGRIDYYIPLKFETKLDFARICRKINRGIDKNITKHYSTIQQDVADIQADLEDKVAIEMRGKLSLVQDVKGKIRNKRKSKRNIISREHMNNMIKLGMTDSGLKIELLLEELESYHDRRNELITMYDRYKEIYGLKFTNSQEIYVLFPMHIQLNNDEYVWLNAMIFVFQNKMGILKLEMPLSNVSSQPLMDYEQDEYIKSIDNPWLIDMVIDGYTIGHLQNAYKEVIRSFGINVKQVGDSFRNIILSDFEGMPKQINNIPNKVLVDLYRIIAAPVTIMDCTTYENEAQNYIKEHQWSKHNSKYICSTTGGCLSITDIAFVDYFFELYKQELGIDKCEEQEKSIIYKKIVNNLCLNVEYAIIIMVLKYMAKEYFYELKLRKPQEMHEVKKEYNMNVMYIAELQENCYGTASEQIEMFEKAMPYYLKTNITTDKLNAIDSLLADEEANRYTALQNIMSIGGLMMTALFGFPAIYETFYLIRRMCVFIKKDIPILTIENVSFFTWLFVLLVAIVSILTKWIGKNGRKIFRNR